MAPVASASPSAPAAAFPTEAFAHISDDPVSRKTAAEFQQILNDLAGGAGMSATVMSADGTWSGATGKADGVRDVAVDDQFSIASTTNVLGERSWSHWGGSARRSCATSADAFRISSG